MMRSLKARLLVGAALTAAITFASLGGILYACVRSWLIAELDRGLAAQAQVLAPSIELRDGRIQIDDEDVPGFYRPGSGALYFEVWQGSHLVSRSASLNGHDLERSAEFSGQADYAFARLPDGRSARRITLEITPHSEEQNQRSALGAAGAPTVQLTIARETVELDRELAYLRLLLICACGAAVVVSGGLLAVIINRGMRPLGRIAQRIERIGRSNLADRLDADRTPAELLPIVNRLNEMLGRLEETFAREKAFTADVAHELRTPLAGLSAALEVAAARPREPKEYQQVVAKCLAAIQNMHAMVETLLALARCESGQSKVTPQEFGLCHLIDQTWAGFDSRASDRGLIVKRTCRGDLQLNTDREKLRLILHNLFDNAISHSNAGGKIDLDVAASGDRFQITIGNSGCLLSPADCDKVFQRFWRGDAARTNAGQHCGLGLAISREMASLLGGEIGVTVTPNGEFIARLDLPRK